jgi:hypothetical protein
VISCGANKWGKVKASKLENRCWPFRTQVEVSLKTAAKEMEESHTILQHHEGLTESYSLPTLTVCFEAGSTSMGHISHLDQVPLVQLTGLTSPQKFIPPVLSFCAPPPCRTPEVPSS